MCVAGGGGVGREGGRDKLGLEWGGVVGWVRVLTRKADIILSAASPRINTSKKKKKKNIFFFFFFLLFFLLFLLLFC